MQFKVQSLPPDQFAMWAQGARGQGVTLDSRTYAELAKPSSYVKPMTYGAVQPGLFEAIVTDRVPQLGALQTTPPAPQAPAAAPEE